LFTAETHFSSTEKANAETVALYFANLALHYQDKGMKKLVIFLDGNSTHKQKMKTEIALLLQNPTIILEFHYFPPYSPKLNLVEYAIHAIRQKCLHHADSKKSLPVFLQNIQNFCQNPIFSMDTIHKTIDHIFSLIPPF